jgi:phosphate transport system substrate-binding protein
MSPAMVAAVASALARPGMTVAPTDQDAAEAIAAVPGALGTTTLGLILSERRPLRVLALDGVTPSLATVGAGSYRHVKTLSLISRPDPPATVRAFVDFARSAAARQIGGAVGYLLIEPHEAR